MNTFEFVQVELRGHVALITLNRPPVNAVIREMSQEVADAFRHLGDNRNVRAAVLTGSGRVFCAGADIKHRTSTVHASRDVDLSPAHQLDTHLAGRDAFWSIYDCAVPVIGAINGPAIGAGLAMASVCDMLVVSTEATDSPRRRLTLVFWEMEATCNAL